MGYPGGGLPALPTPFGGGEDRIGVSHVLGDVSVSHAAGFLLQGKWLHPIPRSVRGTHVRILCHNARKDGFNRGPYCMGL